MISKLQVNYIFYFLFWFYYHNLNIKIILLLAGRDFCMSRCVELCDTYDSLFSANYVVDPLRFLEKSEVLSKHVDTFMQMILQIWLSANLSFMLAPDDPKYYRYICDYLSFPRSLFWIIYTISF